MYKYSTDFLKVCSVLPVFLIVPNYANALSKYDLEDGQHVVLESDSTIKNEVQIEADNRYAGITASGNASVSTGNNTLTIMATTAPAGGRNYIYDTVTAGTDFTFTGNLMATAIGTGNIAARGIRQNAAATANFNGKIDVLAMSENDVAYGLDMWSGSRSTFNGDVSITTKAVDSDSIGAGVWGGSNITFTGTSTNISTAVTGNGMYAYAVQNYGNDYGEIRFQADKTVLTGTGGQYARGAQIYKGRVYFEGDTVINASGGSESTRGIGLQGDPAYDADKTFAVFSGDNIEINVAGGATGLYVSGSYAMSSSKNFVINSDYLGMLSQYSAAILLDEGSNTTVNVKTDQSYPVYGVSLREYAGTGGTIVSKGTLTVNAQGGKDTYGIYVAEKSKLDAKHLDVKVNGFGENVAALAVVDATDVNIGSRDMASRLVATSQDSVGLSLDKNSHVNINGDFDIRGEKYAIYNDGALNITAGQTIVQNDVAGSGTLTIADGAGLNIGTNMVEQGTLNINGKVYSNILNENVYGKLFADEFNVGENAMLVLNNVQVGTYNIFNNYADIKIDAGFLFDVQNNGADGVVISHRSVDKIAADTGLSVEGAALAAAMANSSNRQFVAQYKQMVAELQMDDKSLFEANLPYYNEQAARANPYDKPLLHSMTSAMNNQIIDLATSRMGGGRAGGDMTVGYGAWAQGLYNKTKYSDAFSGSTGGLAFGLDALINRKYTVGIGYANNTSDVDAHNRDVEIESHSLFAYAQYKPNKWFINGALQYTMAEYDEDTTVFGVAMSADYDVNSFGAEISTGYDFDSGITPSVGVRYLYMTQDDYSNELLRVDGADSSFASAVAGLRYAFDIQSDTAIKWSPNLYANATYDFVSDDVYSTVVMPGIANYRVRGDRLSRMGGEFGIGVSARINNVILSLNYELDLHKDYTSQTGLLKLKCNF